MNFKIRSLEVKESDGPFKKSGCYVCRHLEWGYGDVNDSEGFVCNKRQYKTSQEEYGHLDQLNDPIYLSRPKRCQEKRLLGLTFKGD